MELDRDKIIKSLESCVTPKASDCKHCAYREHQHDIYSNCTNDLIGDALALIKELTEENERLRTENEFLLNIKNLNIDKVQADTVRKMQERLKVHCAGNRYWCELIDQIAKEIINESAAT